MQITATELKNRLGHYLEMVNSDDIWVTKNGKPIAKLVNPNISSVEAISGILKDKLADDIDRKYILEERVESYETDD